MSSTVQSNDRLTGGEGRQARFLFGGMYRAVLDAVGSPQDGSVILDVGCGAGWLLSQARRRWPTAKLIGADPAEKALEAAREVVPDATLVLAPAGFLPFPDGSVDAVVSTLSLHHWSDQEAGLREVGRVLRPGGLLVLADFTLPSWIGRLAHGHRLAGRSEVRTLFDAAGFRVLKQRAMYLGSMTVTVGERQG
jgi:SAM-dependent methyltransferase